jgi:SOS-response transcriptional repressor LexA
MPNKGYISPAVLAKLDEVANFIQRYQDIHHYAPSRQNIADEFGVVKSVAAYYLRLMQRLGMVELTPKVPRSLVLIRN